MKNMLHEHWNPTVIAIFILAALHYPMIAAAGEASFTITYTNDVPYMNSVELGEKHVARIAEHILIARNDAGTGFMHNTAASCIVLFVDAPNKSREGNGYCTYRDEDGDQIFEQYNYGAASTGKVTIIGGTGKYTGVSCAGQWKKLATPKSPVKGKWQNIGSKHIKCSMP